LIGRLARLFVSRLYFFLCWTSWCRIGELASAVLTRSELLEILVVIGLPFHGYADFSEGEFHGDFSLVVYFNGVIMQMTLTVEKNGEAVVSDPEQNSQSDHSKIFSFNEF
jgi:hypothetical protein